MTRQEQIEALSQTVRSVGDGYYTVASSDPYALPYLCTPKMQGVPAQCDCKDQRYHRTANPTYRCKHLLALRLYLKRNRPPSVQKMNAAMEHFLKAQEAKRAAAPRSLTLQDQLAELAQKIERGDRSQVTLARYHRLYQKWSEQGDPPLAFLPAF